jgi:hypothetical protein
MKQKGTPLGKGRKLDVYVPPGDLWIIDGIEKRVRDVQEREGVRTSFNAMIVGILKNGLLKAKGE